MILYASTPIYPLFDMIQHRALALACGAVAPFNRLDDHQFNGEMRNCEFGSEHFAGRVFPEIS